MFSNSPVKNVVEKLNPYSQKNKISRLKFERKSDYKTFLKFIKDNTKEVEDIKLPDEKKKTGLLVAGGLGLGLLALTAFRGRGSGSGLEDGENVTDNALEKAAMQVKKISPEVRTKRNLSTVDDPLQDAIEFQRGRTKFRNIEKKRLEDLKKLRQAKRDYVENRLKKRYERKAVKNLKNIQEFEKKFGIKRQTLDLDINPDTGKPYTRYDPEIGMAPEDTRGKTKKVNPFGINDPIDDSFNQPKRKIDKKLFNKSRQLNIFNDLERQLKLDIPDDGLFMRDIEGDPQSAKIRADIEKQTGNRIRDFTSDKKITSSPLDDFLFGKDKDKQLKMFDRKVPLEERVMYNPNQNRAGSTKLTKVTPPKLNMFDKITKFSNQVLNSGIAKGIFSLSNLLYNPKAFLLYSVLRPTTLADGTLEGKPGVGIYDSENYFFDEDTAVNIFMPPEERESMIPFDSGIDIPSVTTPTDLQTPKNDVFIDYEFNTTEDMFFIKMAGS